MRLRGHASTEDRKIDPSLRVATELKREIRDFALIYVLRNFEFPKAFGFRLQAAYLAKMVTYLILCELLRVYKVVTWTGERSGV